MKYVLVTIALFFLALAFPVASWAASNICTDSTCSSAEVGPFMKGITKACGNSGSCTLTDIMQVFHNIGNYILGIIAAIVFLFYVYGGFLMITAGGIHENVKKGKQALTLSTIGLLIVLLAYSAIQTLYTTLRSGSLPEEETQYAACGPGPVNAGASCALNSTCTEDGTCMSACDQNWVRDNGGRVEAGQYVLGSGGTLTLRTCMDINRPGATGCQADLCPGDVNFQCCTIEETL